VSPATRRSAPGRRGATPSPRRDDDYSAEPEGLTPGNRVVPLIDGGDTFAAMLEAIERAQRFVHLETYIFEDDQIGSAFARALIGRARAGVAVRMIVDAAGTWTVSAGFFGELRDAGVLIHEYSPLLPWRRWSRLWQRDHRKILVIDGEVAFTGGINVADDYMPRDLGGKGWRDTHCRVEGPLVGALEELFRALWHAEGQPAYAPYPAAGDPPSGGEQRAALVHKDSARERTIHRHYLHAIRMARRRVAIANAYFVPAPGIRRALRKAARRGVTVDVLIAERGDLRSVHLASQRTWGGLLRAGVHIHLWPDTHMHSKTAVVDGVWTVIGSYNLDYQSLLRNLDVVVEVIDHGLGGDMERIFDRDLQRCRRLELAQWRRRPWWRRALEWLLYRLRRWL